MISLPYDVKYIINYYKIKNDYKNVLKDITKNALDIPCGDFGLLRRCARSDIVFYGNDLFKCVENYIAHMSQCTIAEKNRIIEELVIYSDKAKTCELYNFPNVEWLFHPEHGDYHSGGSYAFCNAVIRQYYLYPDIFKDTWNTWISEYC
jgi:hypothetical protein